MKCWDLPLLHFVQSSFCLLILHTGANTIEQVRDAVNSLIHCWVVRGTGRFADLMAALCKNPNMDIRNDSRFKALHPGAEVEDKVAMYLAICRSPLLHVFDLEEDSFEKITADLHAMK